MKKYLSILILTMMLVSLIPILIQPSVNATMVVMDSSEDFDSPIYSLTEDTNYIYAGDQAGVVHKIQKSNMATVGESNTVGEVIYALGNDANYVYAGDNAGIITQIQKSNMEIIGSCDVYALTIFALVVVGNYPTGMIFIAGDLFTVQKIMLDDFETVEDESASYGESILALAVDGSYLYCAGEGIYDEELEDTFSHVWQLDIEDLTILIDENDSYAGNIHSMFRDSYNDYLYVAGDGDQKVFRIDTTDMDVVDYSDTYAGSIVALSEEENYFYSTDDSSCQLFMVQKSDLAKVNQTDAFANTIMCIENDINFIYAGCLDEHVYKIPKGSYSNYPPDKPTAVFPTNNSVSIQISTTKLVTQISDPNGDDLTVSFYWGNHTLIETKLDCTNDTTVNTSVLNDTWNLQYYTVYYWYVNVSDIFGANNTSELFNFRTEEEELPNLPPNKPTDETPTNNSIGVNNNTQLRCLITDPNPTDSLDVYFYWDNDTLIYSDLNNINNTYVETPGMDLDYATTYYWYVIVNDSEFENVSELFNFETENEPAPNIPPEKPTCVEPANESTGISAHTRLKVHIIDPDNEFGLTVSFYWENHSLIQTIELCFNNTTVQTDILDLEFNVTYYWYANVSDYIDGQNTSDVFWFTTAEFDIDYPEISFISPSMPSNNNIIQTYNYDNMNVTNLNIIMGGYVNFSVVKYNPGTATWITLTNNTTVTRFSLINVTIDSGLEFENTLIDLIPLIRFKATDNLTAMNVTIESNSSGNWSVFKSWSGVAGYLSASDLNMTEYGTKYYCRINATNNYGLSTTTGFFFITAPSAPVSPPSGGLDLTTTAILIGAIIAVMAMLYFMFGRRKRR